MEAIISMQGIKVHVGFYRQGDLYKVDEGDCYVTNEAKEMIAEIENVDKVGAIHAQFGWVSLRFLAEDYADNHAVAWDRAEAQRQQADAAADRRVA